jgi:hypothetical protein
MRTHNTHLAVIAKPAKRKTGIVDSSHARAFRGVNGVLVLLDACCVVEVVSTDYKQLCNVLEGGVKGSGIVEVCFAEGDALGLC